jgi:hypothetical protein
MYWLQKHRKEASQGEERARLRKDHPRWLEASVKGEMPPQESVVVELGDGVRMLVGSRTQAMLAGEVLPSRGRATIAALNRPWKAGASARKCWS